MRPFLSGIKILFFLAPFLVLAGCKEGKTGQVSLSLTDSSTDQYVAVYVTIDEVQVHRSGAEEDDEAELAKKEEDEEGEDGEEGDEEGDEEKEGRWLTVAEPRKTFNLLELVNGVRETLGLSSLETGHYTQMRLIIGEKPDDGINIQSRSHPFANYVIDTNSESHELKVPSGEQTGIKIVRGFDIQENQTTELILDFDASKSIVIAGKSGKYLLKPTIKILDAVDFAILSGRVTDADGNGVVSARVMAQKFNPEAADKKDEVVTASATISEDDEESGAYALFLAPESYHVVVYKTGLNPGVEKVTLGEGETMTQDFSLSNTETGEVAGGITISGADEETFVTVSFRQQVTINESTVMIELVSLNVAHGGSYSVRLPPGEYHAVSSTFHKETQETTVIVVADTSTQHDISF